MRRKQLEKESDVLHHIAEASEAIRRKHKMIKLGKDTAERAMNEVFKPVVTPLEKLVSKAVLPLEDQQQHIMKKKKKKERPPMKLFPHSSENDDETEFGGYGTAIEDEFGANSQSNTTQRQIASSTPIATFRENVSKTIESLDGTIMENTISPMSPTGSQGLLRTYMSQLGKNEKNYLDTEFGVRTMTSGKLKIGDSEAKFDGNSLILKGEKYMLTPRLIELIFDKSPNLGDVTQMEREIYGKIIRSTNAHRKFYKPNNSIRTTNTHKYKNIIRPILTSPKSGAALLPNYMIAPKLERDKIDYIYWDDPNELVERLRLLMASQAAGNNSHTNEIMSS